MKYISQKKTTGFTLIEVMVVVTIIGILMAFALTTLFQARKESRDRARVAELEQLKLSLKLYKEAEGDYPSYDAGEEVTAMASDLAPYTAQAYEDPLNTGGYKYWYDSDFLCNSESYTVVGVEELENTDNSNFSKVCSTAGGTSEAPLGSNSFIILVRKN